MKPQFSVLNEWYYLSILQAFELRSFQPRVEWFAKKLGISTGEVESALRELKNAGMIIESDGFYTPNVQFVKTAEIPSKQIRNYLQLMLKRASDALEAQTIEERDFSSVVVPVDPSKMSELKEWIREFRETFCQKASTVGQPNEVYNLSIQFFRISKQE